MSIYIYVLLYHALYTISVKKNKQKQVSWSEYNITEMWWIAGV